MRSEDKSIRGMVVGVVHSTCRVDLSRLDPRALQESSWWLHRKCVSDLGLVWCDFCWHGEATDAFGSMEPTQVLSVHGLVEWPTKVMHVGGSLCPASR
jgi:hypothetical protein